MFIFIYVYYRCLRNGISTMEILKSPLVIFVNWIVRTHAKIVGNHCENDWSDRNDGQIENLHT